MKGEGSAHVPQSLLSRVSHLPVPPRTGSSPFLVFRDWMWEHFSTPGSHTAAQEINHFVPGFSTVGESSRDDWSGLDRSFGQCQAGFPSPLWVRHKAGMHSGHGGNGKFPAAAESGEGQKRFICWGKKFHQAFPLAPSLKKYLPGYSVINLIRLLIHCLQKTINTDFIAQFYSTIILTLDPLPVPQGIIKLSPFLRNLIPSSLLTHPPHRIFMLLRYPLCRQLTSLSYAQNNFFLPSSYFVTSPRPADVSKLSCSPTLSPNY